MNNDELKHKKALKQLKRMENEDKERLKFKKYLEEFDEYFETNTKEQIKITPLLLYIYREFIQTIYGPSQIYKLALQVKNKITEDLMAEFSNKQKDLFNQWQKCENKMVDDMVEQAFIYRICNILSIKIRSGA